jgi:hypothetical protein
VCGFTRAIESSIRELEIRFRPWCYGCSWDCVSPILVSFVKHLEVLKTIFYYRKTHKVNEQEIKVHELLNTNDFNYQQDMFKFTMKSNAASCMKPPFHTNPLTHMWHLVTTSWILVSSFLEYVKLVKLTMVQIVYNVEDERCFSTLAFMKSKLYDMLTIHLPIVVCMLHNSFIHWKNFHMLNVLSNGKQHDTNIVMMVKVQCALLELLALLGPTPIRTQSITFNPTFGSFTLLELVSN